MGKMSLSVYTKGHYEEFYGLGCKKTKPIQSQSNPIIFSPQIFWGLKDTKQWVLLYNRR